MKMQLLALGINHKTAPVDLREQAVFAPEILPDALKDITGRGVVQEATIVSTCNRTEVYCGLSSEQEAETYDWFCHYLKLDSAEVKPYLYEHPGELAVQHAFRVASGLDSMVLGEPQILGQMKDAFATAHKAGTTGKILNRLFQQTFSVAKTVRTDTAIGASAVSVASAAVTLAKQIFNDLSQKTVMLIGAGEMIELCARHLADNAIGHMIVANRTVERAELVAKEFGAEAISLAEMPLRLSDADIVISSTASQLPILGKGAVERALKERKHRPVFMVDIAVPRDIEPEVGALNDVYLYTVDDLKDVVQENLKSRQQAAGEAEKIIDDKVVEFMRWAHALDAVPTIRALRESAAAIREAEVARAKHQLARGEDPTKVLEQLARSMANKLTHEPTTALRQADHDGDAPLLEAARRLFNLDDD
jgi:glutamyl-tRNA reductase